MNKLIILDLDGVLVDLKDAHYHALNNALESCGYPKIGHDDHLTKYDGLPTSSKLRMLGIDGAAAFRVNELKQLHTQAYISQQLKPDPQLVEMLHECIERGYLLGCVSNAKFVTVKACLERLELQYLISFINTPDSTGLRAKPAPEMYLRMMLAADACPKSTVIYEDAPQGLEGAYKSGAKVVQVGKDRLTKECLFDGLYTEEPTYKFVWPELNVLIPAAGEGKRFKDAGYAGVKPLIDVNGRAMLLRVLDNLNVINDSGLDHQTTIILNDKIHKPYNSHVFWIDAHIDYIPETTRGTAETCLYSSHRFNDEWPLLIANSDQILEWNSAAFYYFCQNTHLDGILVTFHEPSKHPKWSYCEVDSDGLVKRVAEKDPISTTANCGVFYWKHGSDFVRYAKQLIAQDIRTNGEFYLSPVYNLAIADGKKIGTYQVERMHGLGTPEDLTKYLEYTARKSSRTLRSSR